MHRLVTPHARAPWRQMFTGLALTIAAACGSPDALVTPETLPADARLVIGPAALTLTPGLSQQMLAVVTTGDGEPLDVSVRWTSADPSVAQVGASGLVTPGRVGSTDITASIGPLRAVAHLVVQDSPVTSPLLLDHRDIVSTVFWVGESANATNGFIANGQSAFDAEWLAHYGGVDAPAPRRGYLPATFTPLENPFYVALPYSDVGDDTLRKQNAALVVPWAATSDAGPAGSLVKNHWVRVDAPETGRTCYAQWEDAGPGLYDDFPYVFGTAAPANPFLLAELSVASGLDVSPAVRDCLGLHADVMRLTWRFVADVDVPAGPWTEIVTRRPLTR